jgi:hypothetical protein
MIAYLLVALLQISAGRITRRSGIGLTLERQGADRSTAVQYSNLCG